MEDLPVEGQICRVFGRDCKIALAISLAENGTRKCDRVSSTGDVGIFQINYKYHGNKGNLFDCKDNIRVAFAIYQESGWRSWVAYRNKSYLKFLTN